MIKDRVIELIEFKGVEKEFFFKKIGKTSANFRGKAKLSDLSSQTIEKIFSEFPDVSLLWLMTGKGEMFAKDETIRVEEPRSEYGNSPENFKDKYIEVLEELNALRKEYTDLLHQLNELKGNGNITVSGKPVKNASS